MIFAKLNALFDDLKMISIHVRENFIEETLRRTGRVFFFFFQQDYYNLPSFYFQDKLIYNFDGNVGRGGNCDGVRGRGRKSVLDNLGVGT